MTTDARPVVAAELFSIDVDEEIRKLSQGQLQGRWQIATELVRGALRRGAQRVDVRLRHNAIDIVDDSEGPTMDALSMLAVLLTAHADATARHEALVAIEASGELGLLALAGLERPRATILACQAAQVQVFELSPNEAPTLRQETKLAPALSRIQLRGPGLDATTARSWLRMAARFSRATITVDGRPVMRGFPDAYCVCDLRTPFEGQVAVPATIGATEVWLMDHGIVAERITFRDGPGFVAAVEIGPWMQRTPGVPARDILQSIVPQLWPQAFASLIEAYRGTVSPTQAMRARFAALILEAARNDLLRQLARDVEMFPTISAGQVRLSSLEQLAAHIGAHEPTRVLRVVDPNAQQEYQQRRGPLAVVTTERERGLLAQVLDTRLRDTGRQGNPTRRSPVDQTRSKAVIEYLGAGWRWLFHRFRRRAVAPDRLDARELRLIHELRRLLEGDPHRQIDDITFVYGSGPIRHVHGQRLVELPRANPIVAAYVSALARDPHWLYPAFFALCEGVAAIELPDTTTQTEP